MLANYNHPESQGNAIKMLSIIIPANNEEALIGPCLEAVLASDGVDVPVEVIVAANGCSDRTVEISRGFADKVAAKGWELEVLDLASGGKLGALNAADAAANGEMRAYLDADVTVSPALIAGIARALSETEATYASGQVRITGQGWFSRLYARLWSRIPFMTTGVPGCGLFAVNAAGREKWADWPDIISDDTFVRLNFPPERRKLVAASYNWPIAEGFAALVKVRRRQDFGVVEVQENYPHIVSNDGTPGLGAKGYLALAARDPLGFAAYAAVALTVKIKGPDSTWSRSR